MWYAWLYTLYIIILVLQNIIVVKYCFELYTSNYMQLSLYCMHARYFKFYRKTYDFSIFIPHTPPHTHTRTRTMHTHTHTHAHTHTGWGVLLAVWTAVHTLHVSVLDWICWGDNRPLCWPPWDSTTMRYVETKKIQYCYIIVQSCVSLRRKKQNTLYIAFLLIAWSLYLIPTLWYFCVLRIVYETTLLYKYFIFTPPSPHRLPPWIPAPPCRLLVQGLEGLTSP